jgi:DNA-binding NtrC family response regulator
VQAKLLRALQEKEIRRLGSSKSIKVDIRVIAATNADLTCKIANKEFREDLYYRLNTIPLHIPPLRERKEEILPIAQAICVTHSKKYGFETKHFSKEAEQELQEYQWPGNIRELISVVERAVILSENNEIQKEDLFLEVKKIK